MANIEHYGGSFGTRVEYSEAPTPEFECAKDELVKLLELVTFEDVRLRRGSYVYRDGVTRRNYRYIREESNQVGAYPIENIVNIYHEKLSGGGDSYAVRVAWRALPAHNENMYATDYLVERYIAGPTHLSMWEIDMGTGLTNYRPMTPYDNGQLLHEFTVMADSLRNELVE